MRMRELAQARPRYGYRRIHVLLRRDGWAVKAPTRQVLTGSPPSLAAVFHSHLQFLVEPFFGLITENAIGRGSFGSVKELVGQIDHFVTQYNKHWWPFVWTATAESILGELERLTSRISRTGH